MKRYISKDTLNIAIEYFRSKNYLKPEQIGLFFYFKAAGLNSVTYNTYKTWGDNDSADRAKYFRLLYDLAGVFDVKKETGVKYTALFPFSICRQYRSGSFYNGGSPFKTLCSRVSDTLDNALVSTIIHRNGQDKNLLKLSDDCLNILSDNYLKGQKIPLILFAAWCYKFWEFDMPEGYTSQDVQDACVLSFLYRYNISVSEYKKLFFYGTQTILDASAQITGDELRSALAFDNNDCKPEILNESTVDYMPTYLELDKDTILSLLSDRGEVLDENRILELLTERDSRIIVPTEIAEVQEHDSKYTPEWFKEKAQDYTAVDTEATSLYKEFQQRFAPSVLSTLDGKDLLNELFYAGSNTTNNMCYFLDVQPRHKYLFGGRVVSYQHNFGLYKSSRGEWIHGRKDVVTEDEAIVIGKEIRDKLIFAAECVDSVKTELLTVADYETLEEVLSDELGDFVTKMWVIRYLHMIYPELFSTFFNLSWQTRVLSVLGQSIAKTPFTRNGQISIFVKSCGISNVVWARIFYDNYAEGVETRVNEITSEEGQDTMPSRIRRMNKIHPLNIILYGAPGTGKTYATAEYAIAILNNKEVDRTAKSEEQRIALMSKYRDYVSEGRIVFTTFHQSYGYEDFVQGLRPDTSADTMIFKPIDGVFKRIADMAMQDQSNDYVLIIDEINRANISKVFGELITLIEDDKRWGEINALNVTLPSGDVFAVPNNLYIVGTMNSADKSISLIDTALRRRFEFVEVAPNPALIKDDTLRAVFNKINSELFERLESTDLLVGHAYFLGKTKKDLCSIINRCIIPLLYEYFYDNRKKVSDLLDNALKGLPFEVLGGSNSRLSIKEKD